jgi:hypothetical protein
MGWNSRDTFGHTVTESVIRETADALVSPGPKDYGYNYIVIDDCWPSETDVTQMSGAGTQHLALYVTIVPEAQPSGSTGVLCWAVPRSAGVATLPASRVVRNDTRKPLT